jgi:ABC-type spermidine/putrescine transport system permease subunit II
MMRRVLARLETPVGRAFIWFIVCAAFVFLYAPMIVVAGAALGGGARPVIEFPPSTFSLARFTSIPASQYRAIWLSIELASAAAIVGVMIGVPA